MLQGDTYINSKCGSQFALSFPPFFYGLQALTDLRIALVIFLLVVVDLVILGVYTVVEVVRGNLKAERIRNKENSMDISGVRTANSFFQASKLS